ncbi:hypothetical protein GCM10011375_39860 [Hymenobacter qilianensis]|uniref:Uncharacterized protein n=2 Tax=Hymenobacter qilianensis TaxID=1385715 RepID=A0ACB5PX39_9BACT|nr:DUF1259 domain-containing protein [Hymenobacter qilianensis]QNP54368.1 DUF1259 domain-containing protein [Hymenobacter qilianensis]GGF80833.1 hypothetical protein GCM10011375_39860 [Hymenobacter qilianensis]
MPDSRFSRRAWLKTAALATTPVLLGTLPAPASEAASVAAKTPALTAAEIAAVEAALGKKGTYVEPQATHTTALPRNDLKVTIKGEPVPISLGFGGWVALKHTLDGKSAMLMSDTVLLQEEVNPLMSAALAQGLEIGAVHNHFFYEEPRIFYMHIHGMGSPAELAQKFAAALKDSKLLPANQPKPAVATTPAQPGTNAPPSAGPPTGKELFDLPALDKLVGYQGVVNGPTYKYTVGRADLQSIMMGTEMTAAIGLNSWAAFAGKQADSHIAGDITMLEHEVNPVIKVLRAHNLEVVAVHNHMLFDQPRMMFLHYYGRGPAAQLATGFRAALDQLGKGKSPAGVPMKH